MAYKFIEGSIKGIFNMGRSQSDVSNDELIDCTILACLLEGSGIDHSHLSQAREHGAKLEYTRNLESAIERIGQGNLNVIVTDCSDERLGKIVEVNRSIPTVSLLHAYSETTDECFERGVFDVVVPSWRLLDSDMGYYKNQVRLAIENAHMAGKMVYASGGESYLGQERDKSNYTVALLEGGDQGRPKLTELLKQLGEKGYRVLPSRDLEGFNRLIGHISPGLSIIYLKALDGEKKAVEELMLNQQRCNNTTRTLFILDNSPPHYILDMFQKMPQRVFYYQRPSNLVLFNHTIDTITGDLDQHNRTREITDPRNALLIGLGYYFEWDSAPELIEDLRHSAVGALRRFRELARSGQYSRNVAILVNDLDCADGAIEIVNPNTAYEVESARRFLLKQFKLSEATQAYDDWTQFFASGKPLAGDPYFRTAEILRRPLPVGDGSTFLLEEDLIGPNSADVLRELNGSNNPLAYDMRDAIVSQRIKEYMFWRKNMPTLTSQETYSLEQVKKGYIGRLAAFFENFGRFSDVQIPQEQVDRARSAINNYQWGSLLTDETIMRYFSGTFRNSIIRTGWINITPDALINMFSDDNALSREKLGRAMYSIDHAAKDAHHLEDVWEILDFFDAHLDNAQKAKFYRDIQNQSPNNIPDIDAPESMAVHLFRTCREAGLFMAKYWPKLASQHEAGIISDDQFGAKKAHYLAVVGYHLGLAVDLVKSLPLDCTLSGLCDPLKYCSGISELKYSGAANGRR